MGWFVRSLARISRPALEALKAVRTASAVRAAEKMGVGWHVRAVYPGNRVVEHITGFTSEAAAKEWIASDDARAWLRSRGYPDD
jgi:hypothetical protein